MKKSILSVAAVAAMTSATANAALNVQLMNVSMSSSYTMTEDAMSDKLSEALQFGAMYNYVNRPLVEVTPDRKTRTADVISAINTVDITGGYYFNDRFFVGADMPINMVTMPGKAQQFSLADSRLLAKVRLTEDKAPVSFALIPELYIPTGDRSLYLSDGAFGGGIKAALEHEFGKMRVSGNLGFRHNEGSSLQDINYHNRLTGGLGSKIYLGPKWSLNVEVSGAMLLPQRTDQNMGEAYLGARYLLRQDMAVTLGGAVGAFNNVGSSDYRIVAGLQIFAVPTKSEPTYYAPAPQPRVSAVAKPVIAAASARVFYEHKQIRVTEEVKFKHDSSELVASGMSLLDEVAQVIKKNQPYIKTITIEGHTNEIGSHQYNMNLSRERAASVKEYLTSRGVPESMLATVGYGKTRPKVMPGLAKQARLNANRRVEFKVQEQPAKRLVQK
ncbi:MAG: OmpA family protein [Deltaproteobacteria bacterium]|nr:OmpA family protein [Deltaproteobacteria bacterium]